MECVDLRWVVIVLGVDLSHFSDSTFLPKQFAVGVLTQSYFLQRARSLGPRMLGSACVSLWTLVSLLFSSSLSFVSILVSPWEVHGCLSGLHGGRLGRIIFGLSPHMSTFGTVDFGFVFRFFPCLPFVSHLFPCWGFLEGGFESNF